MNNVNKKFDVAVVGGGPAGITAAATLGKKGYSTIVLEAGVYPGAENWSGTVYFAENLVHEEAFGPDLFEKAPYERKLVKRGFSAYDGMSMFGASYKNEHTFRNCYTVLRPIFDRYLSERVKEWGVSVLPETTVQSLIRENGRVIGCQTERGPVYANCVFLAEGDASHLTTQEGYEQVEDNRPEFLQGIKEVIQLPPDVIEERFDVSPGKGSASEVLIRNGNIGGETARLNMGAFIYTNRESISIGLVLPLHNLKNEFSGDHNDLMEWFKGLPEIQKRIEGGSMSSFGTKIIRGGGYNECPQIVDDGLAIGGAATGIGVDFPYPNFTGPATRMGLLFGRAYDQLQSESRDPDRQALEETYLTPLKKTHYYKNVRFLKDFPSYVEKTKVFFERQIDLISGTASIATDTSLSSTQKLRTWVRHLRNILGGGSLSELVQDRKNVSQIFGLPGHVWSNLDLRMLGYWFTNSFQAFLPGDAYPKVDEGKLKFLTSSTEKDTSSQQVPALFHWLENRFRGPLKQALRHVYRNDETPIEDKLRNATRSMMSGLSFLDFLLMIPAFLCVLILLVTETVNDFVRFRILKQDVSDFLNRPEQKYQQQRRSLGNLSLEKAKVSKDEKLGTISYHDTERSNIKVFWPDQLQDRKELESSPLWHVCPARVYDVHTQYLGNPDVVVNFENCIKCETCWRASEDVHWSRSTEHRMIYETYSPSHVELVEYLENRPLPHPNLPEDSPEHHHPSSEQIELLKESDPDFSFANNPATNGGLKRIPPRLKRLRTQLSSLPDHIEDLPPVLEQGRKYWLEKHLESIEQVVEEIDLVLKGKSLLEVRKELHRSNSQTFYDLWQEILSQLERMREALNDEKPFWMSLIGDKLLDHHLPQFEQSIFPILEEGDIALTDPLLPSSLREITVCSPDQFGSNHSEYRETVRAKLDDTFEHQDIKKFERGTPLTEEQQAALANLIGHVPLQEAISHTRSRILVEELSRLDPSLGWSMSHHLWGLRFLSNSEIPSDRLAPYLEGNRWLAVLQQTDLESSNISRSNGTSVNVTGRAEFVPFALADTFILPGQQHVLLIDRDDEGIDVTDENPSGLRGADMKRVMFHQYETEDVWALDRSRSNDHWIEDVKQVTPFYVDMVRGGCEYLLHRAKDHADSRVQFPGQFQDEAGKDSIAKFGAVKEMLADLEEQRYLLETLSTLSPSRICPECPEVASVVQRLESGFYFGPEIGSFSYNTGQIFGGTAFSEDDFIAKFYRDSSVTRFLVRNPDQLAEWLGKQWVHEDSKLNDLPASPSNVYEALFDQILNEPLLDDVWSRFESVQKRLNAFLDELRNSETALEQTEYIQAGERLASYLALRSSLLRTYLLIVRGENPEKEVQACEKSAMDLLSEIKQSRQQFRRGALIRKTGETILEYGPFEPVPSMDLPYSYEEFLESDQSHQSGQSLLTSYDPSSPRLTPELGADDKELHQFDNQLRMEVRDKYYSESYTEGDFDGRCYPRYLEEIHALPDEDLDYLRDNGYLRIPIDEKYGGEGHLKATYYQLCDTFMRFADPAMALCIMVNTSIGTTPIQLGLKQDLPAGREELSEFLENPEQLSEIGEAIDQLLVQLENPDPGKLKSDFESCEEMVRDRIRNSSVLKYIAGGFLRTFYDAAQAGQKRDLERFEQKLEEARNEFDRIEAGIKEKIQEYKRREKAHEQHLRMISAGWISAFALTEPTAGSDSGGVKTKATLERSRVYRDENGLPYFFPDGNESDESERKYLLDADRMTFDPDQFRSLYQWDEDESPVELHFDEYDYEKDRPDGKKRYIRINGEKQYFHDIGLVRTDEDGQEWYEYYLLNGAKMWITNGRFANMFNLYAQTEEGVSGFMVDRHAEGLVVGKDEDKLGQKGSPTNELSLKDVRVPRENVIGILGRGQVNALESLNAGRIGLAFCSSGIMQDIVERGTRYLDERDENDWQTPERVQHLFGQLAENIIGTDALAHDLVGFVDHPDTDSIRMESAVGKYYASETVHEAINYGEHLRGIEGQTDRHDIEKKRRDARVITIYEGTNEVQRFLLLKDLVQKISDERELLEDAAPDTSNYPELLEEIQECRAHVHELLQEATAQFDDQVWQQVSFQPVFFRLSEMAGLIKLMFSTLQRMDLVTRHADPDSRPYADLIESSGRLFIKRAIGDLRACSERYRRRYEYLTDNRYPPQIMLGFQSLEQPKHRTNQDQLPEPQVHLTGQMHISVPIKPVPKTAPEPRLHNGKFNEPLEQINPADRAALEEALQLKRSNPEKVELSVTTVTRQENNRADVQLRRALMLGADRAIKYESDANQMTSSTTARVLADGYQNMSSSPDLIFLGSSSIDTEQGATGPLLAELLQLPHLDDVSCVKTLEFDENCHNWSAEVTETECPAVNGSGPAVLAFDKREITDDFTVQDALHGWSQDIQTIKTSVQESSLTISHRKRRRTSDQTEQDRAETPEEAVRKVLELTGRSKSDSESETEPVNVSSKQVKPFKKYTAEETAIFVAPPLTDESFDQSVLNILQAGRMLSSNTSRTFATIVPTNQDLSHIGPAVGQLAQSAVDDVILIQSDDLLSYAWPEYRQILLSISEECSPAPDLWIGPDDYRDVFCRIEAAHEATLSDNRTHPASSAWYSAESFSTNNGHVELATSVLEDRLQAVAQIDREDEIFVTFTEQVEPREPSGFETIERTSPDLYRHAPDLDIGSPTSFPQMFSADLAKQPTSIEEANILIDVGYGVGDADGMKTVVEPLKHLLEEELELDGVMVGATRKVTQDLEILPNDRQIGQTGTRVQPDLLFALGVSGAPQHIDYIGEATTILAFNIDDDAPIMTFNEDRPAPVVHPIKGDLFETVPEFIEATKRALGENGPES